MRGLKSKTTLMQFLFKWFGLLFVISLISSTIMVNYISHQAAEDTICSSMKREIRKCNKLFLSKRDYTDEEIDRNIEMEECSIVLLDKSGAYIRGAYPESYQKAVEEKVQVSSDVKSIDTDKDTFYIIDRRIGHDLPGDKDSDLHGCYLRAIADADETETIYHEMRNRYYMIVAFLSMLLLLVAVMVYSRVAKPIKEMVTKAEKISKANTYSERITTDNWFYETEVMTNAYNRILDNTENLIQQQEKFNSDVSHELRTPVSIIRSECELIKDLYEKEIPKEVNEALDVIKQQSDRMKDMITELLYLSRVDQSSELQETEKIDIVDILESVYEDTQFILQGSRVLEHDFESVYTDVDLTLIMIAIRNLMTNAVKYSAEGSRIKLSNTFDDEWIYISVEDEGIGITEEELYKIFDCYYQVSKERNSEGFGLGLTLAQRIAVKHGGYITVKSKENEGSTFTLVLPVAKEE